MSEHVRVNFQHPANADILAYLGSPARLARSVSTARHRASCTPAEVKDPYMTLGTHPDLVARLWDELTVRLPADCRWVVHGTPVLVHPASGLLFAFGGGTHTYALRLPEAERQAALRAGAKRLHTYPAYPELQIEASSLNLDDIGEEWIFGGWLKGEEEWCLAAYEFAGAGENTAG